MAECIKREDVLELAKRGFIVGNCNYSSVVAFINDIPSADVRPVVRGQWVDYPECLKYMNAYADDHIVCSACEECFSILDNDCERFNYCPNCGADMREES